MCILFAGSSSGNIISNNDTSQIKLANCGELLCIHKLSCELLGLCRVPRLYTRIGFNRLFKVKVRWCRYASSVSCTSYPGRKVFVPTSKYSWRQMQLNGALPSWKGPRSEARVGRAGVSRLQAYSNTQGNLQVTGSHMTARISPASISMEPRRLSPSVCRWAKKENRSCISLSCLCITWRLQRTWRNWWNLNFSFCCFSTILLPSVLMCGVLKYVYRRNSHSSEPLNSWVRGGGRRSTDEMETDIVIFCGGRGEEWSQVKVPAAAPLPPPEKKNEHNHPD